MAKAAKGKLARVKPRAKKKRFHAHHQPKGSHLPRLAKNGAAG